MISRLKNIHLGEPIAILGSAPSLKKFEGRPSRAIAVNGAAFVENSYSYFLAGDLASPLQKWFYESKRYGATRIVSSFIAPLDSILYPDPEKRKVLQKKLSAATAESREAWNRAPLYDYQPELEPESPHLWFQYSHLGFPFNRLPMDKDWNDSRLVHGATIGGVALQLAFWMGSREIHLYGFSMDNQSGNNYLFPDKSNGMTTDSQTANFRQLIGRIEKLGAKIHIHGASRLKVQESIQASL